MKCFLSLLLVFCASQSYAQNRGNIWCFGDSAGINFNNLSNPVPIHSAVKSRGSCVSIADTSGNLLYYAYTRAGVTGNTTFIKNRYHTIMPNGTNIVGQGWYSELTTFPMPESDSLYYLLTIGVTASGLSGLYYSIIDMSLDSGRGSVVQKNIPLMGGPSNDGLIAIKHCNGRDWWIMHRQKTNVSHNTYHFFLVSPIGITGPFNQNIGTPLNTNIMSFCFNSSGNKMAMAFYGGVIETFHFDRCTGLLSNHELIIQTGFGPTPAGLWSCAFSPNERFLYVSSQGDPVSHLMQIDLQDSTPWSNCDTIWKDSVFANYAGDVKLGPDDKIYFSCNWYNGINWNFPLPDTLYDSVITHLTVINSPDSLGATCDIQPYSFYLGGERTYLGLPNNPDYDLPPIQGSPCDTLQWTNLTPGPSPKERGVIHVFYHDGWDIAFINAGNLKGRNCLLTVYDVAGKKVFETKKQSLGGYFTFDLNCNFLNAGLYIVKLQTEKEMLSAKFIKE